VINGDFLDAYAVSAFSKDKQVILKHEYDIALEYLRWFSLKFPFVVLVAGNHEYRVRRNFNSEFLKGATFLVNADIMSHLASGCGYDMDGNTIKNYNFKNVVYQGGTASWWCKIGKTIFLHPKNNSKNVAVVAKKAQEYFMESQDVDCVCCAHTHRQSWAPIMNKLAIEQGSLCHPLDYANEGNLNYKDSVLGYAVVYQDKHGNCDFTRSGPIYLGTSYLKREPIDNVIERKIAEITQ
jgi:predicted phosphodiesterase